MKNVILHAFNWSYPLVADRAADIARAGYGAVLFPPPLYSRESRSVISVARARSSRMYS